MVQNPTPDQRINVVTRDHGIHIAVSTAQAAAAPPKTHQATHSSLLTDSFIETVNSSDPKRKNSSTGSDHFDFASLRPEDSASQQLHQPQPIGIMLPRGGSVDTGLSGTSQSGTVVERDVRAGTEIQVNGKGGDAAAPELGAARNQLSKEIQRLRSTAEHMEKMMTSQRGSNNTMQTSSKNGSNSTDGIIVQLVEGLLDKRGSRILVKDASTDTLGGDDDVIIDARDMSLDNLAAGVTVTSDDDYDENESTATDNRPSRERSPPKPPRQSINVYGQAPKRRHRPRSSRNTTPVSAKSARDYHSYSPDKMRSYAPHGESFAVEPKRSGSAPRVVTDRKQQRRPIPDFVYSEDPPLRNSHYTPEMRRQDRDNSSSQPTSRSYPDIVQSTETLDADTIEIEEKNRRGDRSSGFQRQEHVQRDKRRSTMDVDPPIMNMISVDYGASKTQNSPSEYKGDEIVQQNSTRNGGTLVSYRTTSKNNTMQHSDAQATGRYVGFVRNENQPTRKDDEPVFTTSKDIFKSMRKQDKGTEITRLMFQLRFCALFFCIFGIIAALVVVVLLVHYDLFDDKEFGGEKMLIDVYGLEASVDGVYLGEEEPASVMVGVTQGMTPAYVRQYILIDKNVGQSTFFANSETLVAFHEGQSIQMKVIEKLLNTTVVLGNPALRQDSTDLLVYPVKAGRRYAFAMTNNTGHSFALLSLVKFAA